MPHLNPVAALQERSKAVVSGQRPRRLRLGLWRSMLLSGLAALGVGLARPIQAAERVNVRIGPLRQTIYVSDLESFARTGDVPQRLRLYQSLLTPELRTALNNRLALDPAMAERVVADVLASPNGRLLLDSLVRVAPGLTPRQIQAAIGLAARQADGFNVLGILRAVPQESLDVDLTAAIALASQLNLSKLEGEALSSVLERELEVPGSDSPTGLTPASAGPVAFERKVFNFIDAQRSRPVPLDLYVPERAYEADAPLVVLSHGFGANRRFLAYVAEHLASYGFTVAAIEHVGSNVTALNGTPLDPVAIEQPSRILPASEFLDRPRDVSYVLDRLAQLQIAVPDWAERYDPENVVLLGHSLGGYTGFALGGARLNLSTLEPFCKSLTPVGLSPADWLQCAAVDLPEQTADLTDERVTQVIAMNPLVGRLFGAKGLKEVAVPTLILTGTRDGVTPTLPQQLAPFTQLPGPKRLVAVIGGTHLSVGDPNNVNDALTQIPFMPELPDSQTADLRSYLRAMTLSVVMQQTSAAERYRPFLEPAYAQSFSSNNLPIRLTERLPASVEIWLRTVHPDKARAEGETLRSWMHLRSVEARRNLLHFQQQLVALLHQEQVTVTVLYWPLGMPFI